MFLIELFKAISTLLGILTAYKMLMAVIGFFATKRYPKAKCNHRYAVLIAARNEENVLANLIGSIREQDYPSELVDIFVVADNCTDRTAEIARNCGAICYERRDSERRTKGFALQYLVNCIWRDYGKDAYEGYFVFDADNILKRDFITRMNEAFDAGEKVVTSFRNTKNFDDNWIAASYALHWLRTARTEHRGRSLIGLSARVQGTGFLFAGELIPNGWNYTSFTEDRAFSAEAVVNGYHIAYNDQAEFYDEQPTNLRIAFRQRIRWAKGHLQSFTESGGKLFMGIFRHRSLVCYDMLWTVVPEGLISLFLRVSTLLVGLVLVAFSAYAGHTAGGLLASYAANFFKGLCGNFALAAYVLFMESKRVSNMKWTKRLWYCVTFPLFDVIGLICTVLALFMHVEWKPIPHNVKKSAEEMERGIKRRGEA